MTQVGVLRVAAPVAILVGSVVLSCGGDDDAVGGGSGGAPDSGADVSVQDGGGNGGATGGAPSGGGVGGTGAVAGNAGTAGQAGSAGAGNTGACSGVTDGGTSDSGLINPGCPPLFGDCDGDASNGCETDLGKSTDHCGGCGLKCGGINSTGKCVFGQCQLTCDNAWGDCDCDPFNGCETTLVTKNDCGGCGKRCGDENTTTSKCEQGQFISCTVVCAPGFKNCDNDLSNGCEANLNTNVPHCGGCDTCAGTNATGSCSNGTCTLTCNSGFGNCDNSNSNGCEVDLDKHPSHCGSCGKSCNGGVCNQGKCSTAPQIVAAGVSSIDFAIDATHVYGLSGKDIFKAPKAGGAVTTLATGLVGPKRIAVNSTDVFVIANGIRKIPKSGGTLTLLEAAPAIAIAVDDAFVYYAQNGISTGGIYRVSTAGGTPTKLMAGMTSVAHMLLATPHVYFTRNIQSPFGSVARIATTGGSFLEIAETNRPFGISINSTTAYWGSSYGNSRVSHVPLAGGTPTTFPPSTVAVSGYVAATETHVYWGASLPLPNGWSVVKAPTTGAAGSLTVLATGQQTSPIHVDATHVYWSYNTVRRLPK